jgi:hypothetical protein
MDRFRGSSSISNVINDNQEPEHSSPIRKPLSDEKAENNNIPKPFFFYGSLTDPLILQEVL